MLFSNSIGILAERMPAILSESEKVNLFFEVLSQLFAAIMLSRNPCANNCSSV